MKVDLYTAIHKAQRFHMFRLSDQIGKTDFADQTAVQSIHDALRHIIAHLRDHARNEETYIHPLYTRLGNMAHSIEDDHHALEDELAGLEKLIEEKRNEEIYPAYARFLGAYLIHLDEEETAQRQVLWQNYGDADLAAVFNRFKAERAPTAAKADLEFMLPALSVPELTRMFQGIKASAPALAFQSACGIASKALGTEWERVAAQVC